MAIATSCSSPSWAPEVERALKKAGDNRSALESVLRHYEETGDSMGLSCAQWLIANMSGKGTADYSAGTLKASSDLKTITADYLIDNIDLALEARRRFPWCQTLTEKVFRRTILPYRLQAERLEPWRRYYLEKYGPEADSLAAKGATIEEVVFYFNTHHQKRYIHEMDTVEGDMPYTQIEATGGGTCEHLALNACQSLRAIGVALNLDRLPFHGRVNGGHAYNSFYTEQGALIYFSPYERDPERRQWVAPQVRRVVFDRPGLYEVVTEEYYPTADVELDVENLSVATFNRGRLKKISDGKNIEGKSLFQNLSQSLLYFPIDSNGKAAAGVAPFILGASGEPQFILDPSTTDSIRIDGISLYDVKRRLTLGRGNSYALMGWRGGWKPLAWAMSRDSLTLDFGQVPDYHLFLIVGPSSIEQMQRPFIVHPDGSYEFF